MFINGKTNSFFQHTYLEMLSKDFKNFGVGKKYFYKLLICGVHQPTQKKKGLQWLKYSVLDRKRVQAIAMLERVCGKSGCQGRLWPDGRESTECLAGHLDSPL